MLTALTTNVTWTQVSSLMKVLKNYSFFSVIFTRPQKCCGMVSMLTLNVVDPWGLVKPKIIKLVRMQH